MYSEYIIPISLMIFIFGVLILLLKMLKKRDDKRYQEKVIILKNTKPQMRFKLLDVFGYHLVDYVERFALIEEANNNKIYALKIKDDLYNRCIKKIINPGDVGLFWIEEVKNNVFVNKNDNENKKEFKSENPSFDYSLLKKATFINGHIEFDKDIQTH